MIDALFFRLDVPVQHRRIRVQPRLMRLARRIEPHLPARFVIANNLAHARMENFGAATRAGIHASFFHLLQNFFRRNLRDARKEMHFDHGERFEMNPGAALFQPAHHLQIVIEGQIRMQPANDVEFRRAFAHALFCALVNLFQCVNVCAGSVRIATKRTQPAMRQAHVRRIDVAIDVEIGDIAVPLFTHVIRKPADREQIGRPEQ